ncbi:MAG: hypothetical protein JWM16_1555 [Verrucomicrobiales bacterium]|nr:hypothetical protein [Verrucomicrobiales bacterium]
MELTIAIFLGIVGVYGVFAFYRLVSFVSRTREKNRLKRHNRFIDWPVALQKVKAGMGYFLLTKTRSRRELFYVDGEPPPDPVSLTEAYRDRALLIGSYNGPVTLTALQERGAECRCVELNLDALVI